MEIYDLRVNYLEDPVGIDVQTPVFSWKASGRGQSVMQKSCVIELSDDVLFENVIWRSVRSDSDKSVNIKYEGAPLNARTRYYWRVRAEYTNGEICKSRRAYFETGFLKVNALFDMGAEWIGSPRNTVNPDVADEYAVTAVFSFEEGDLAAVAVAARSREDYTRIEFDHNKKSVRIYEVTDGIKTLKYERAVHQMKKNGNTAYIRAYKSLLTVILNGEMAAEKCDLIPRDITNRPRRCHMMNFGLPQESGCAAYKYIKIENTRDDNVYRESDFENDSDVLSALGEVKNGELIVRDCFYLINPVPPVNVRKRFTVRGEVKKARLYASARGFYDAYVNGERINDTFYNPGFTDYRKRIYYQTYDVTENIRQGENNIGAVIAKGYYSGFTGYSGAMIYGKQSSFICALIITYRDGSEDTILTDGTWQFTDKCAVLDADYQQGESYDARLKLDFNDSKDNRWICCGVYYRDIYAKPTNGELINEEFEMSAAPEKGAVIERYIKPVSPAYEMPKGHFVFDFGQNMVGTAKFVFNGERGRTVKIRYGEMCSADGRVYTENLRNAANVDTYTMGGGREEFIPSFTSHGFRYMEISGSGEPLTREDFDRLIISAEGVVITNTPAVTGEFECSDGGVNKLFNNIIWGQRGNSLLVFTDCPQRNERMGWTGDAQVFAKTAAYNMNVKAFMDKWLTDLRDSQLMYNLDGAVPDTAPLGGDNRKGGGCGGWGDSAVIVPWEIYKAYGDIDVLKNNYEMMKKWVDYQSRPDRQNRGVRRVNGIEAPDRSDLACESLIQIQQSRGDHLAVDRSTPFILSATAFAAHSADILSRVAAILGNSEDEAKYRSRFESVKKAFNEAWVRDDGTIAYWGEQSFGEPDSKGRMINETYYCHEAEIGASQTAYALAIDFGLIPYEKLNMAAEGLKKAVNDFSGKLSVGFLGISHLTNALSKVGLSETAFSLLEETDNPSWLYSVKNGATTIWERWSSYIAETDTFAEPWMNSFNHYAYGSVGEWLFSDVLGISTSACDGEAGYKKIILKPSFGGSIKWAKGSFDSPYGVIKSEWEFDGSRFMYSCSVPVNTTAWLYLPSKDAPDNCDGYEDGRALYRLGSGEYKFETMINRQTDTDRGTKMP